MTYKQAKDRFDEILSGMEDESNNVTYVAITLPEKNNYQVEYGFRPIDGTTPIQTYFKNNPFPQELFEEFVERNNISFQDGNEDSFSVNFSKASLLSCNSNIDNLGYFEKIRPLKGGISIGTACDRRITGTLGGLFSTKELPNVSFFITCQHVLVHPMDIFNNQPNDLIFQPSDDDFNKLNSKSSTNNSIGYGLNGVFDGIIDASIGIVKTNIKTSNGVFNYCKRINGINSNYKLNSDVYKTGRSSQTVSGRLLSNESAVKIKNPAYTYDNSLKKHIIFKDQIMTDRVGQKGDSGSLLLNDKDEVLGMAFAKVDFVTPKLFLNTYIPFQFSGRTFHNKIDNIVSNKILFNEFKFLNFK